MPHARTVAQPVRIDRHWLGPADETDKQQQRAKWIQVRQRVERQSPLLLRGVVAEPVRDPCVGQLVNGETNQQDHGLGK